MQSSERRASAPPLIFIVDDIMRLSVILGFSLCSLACAQAAEKTDRAFKLPDKDICEIKAAVEKLKPGMTMPEVQAVLKKTNLNHALGIGGGPVDQHYSSFQLNGECSVVFVYNHKLNPPVLLKVWIGTNCCASIQR